MDGLSLEIAKKLDMEPARYSIRKTDIKHVFISQGRTDFSTVLFEAEVPRRVIICFVKNEYFVGDKSKNATPFYFEHFNIRDIEIIANGRIYPQQPYNLDFGGKNYIRAYHDFQEYLGFANTTESNGINYKKYPNGFCFFAFMLTNAQEDSPGFELIKDGTTSVNIRFEFSQNKLVILPKIWNCGPSKWHSNDCLCRVGWTHYGGQKSYNHK
jgi:hypothetical protein